MTLFVRLFPDTRSIGTRLQLATATAVVAVGLLLGAVYAVESARIVDDRVALLHAVTNTAAGIAAGYEAEVRAGRLSADVARRMAATAIGAMRYFDNQYVWVSDVDYRMVMHPIKPELNGTDIRQVRDPSGLALFAVAADIVRDRGEGTLAYQWPRPGSDQPVPKLSYVQGFAPWGWVIGTGVYADDLTRAKQHMAEALAGFGVAAAFLVGAVIALLGRSVARPTRALTAATDRLSKGDLAVTIPGLTRADELGALARALAVLQANSSERLRLERAAADDRAARDRRQAAMERQTQDFGTVISGVLTRLTGAAGKMSDTAQHLADGTSRTRRSATQTAEGSTASSRDLATVAAATVELSASVDEISRRVADTTTATREAVGRSSETDATFVNLAGLAERIGDVGRTISGIAGQTNLLALNATIEAARAGDAGKGFAVVANEVKALAGQTTRATTEIGEKVTGIGAAVKQTAEAIRLVGGAISRVDAVTVAIAAAIEQQGATTREIAHSVQAVAQTSERTASAMAEVAAIADRTGAMSQTVLAASADIGEVANTLRTEVDDFLHTMAQTDSFSRRYERTSCHGRPARLIVPDGGTATGKGEAQVAIQDISRGGAALRTSWRGDVGVTVQLAVPGAPTPLGARVVRHDGTILAVAFCQDQRTLADVDAAVAVLTQGGALAQAA